ncbi:DNA repair protein XRCC2 isoform X2 [Brienomyrus brachyistius]|uniref:DNA repair protein XRCC2 isoform X2 n=1 Tax=Brienomyrus brachyistius TaxID=42636 RepID=UPI0020B1CAB0|nr:DNA repair protein XRCC2 isoform X2 [Brienomyrus brachyistius]
MTHPSRSSESGAQLLARLEGKRCLKGLDFQLFPDDCCPAQGELGGLEVEVMYVDTDYHFDILRLVSILEHRLPQGSEEILRACLCRISVVHCSSSLQLLLTLHHVEGTLLNRPSLSLLVIDSISAFYWVDKYNGGDSVARQEANLRRIAELLEKIVKEHRIAVFATTHAVMRSNSAEEVAEVGGTSWKRRSVAPSDFTKVYLCRPWQRIVTHRVLFSKANMTNERKQVFTAVSSSGRTNSTKRSSFCMTNAGIQFL